MSTLYTRLQLVPDQRARRGVPYPMPMLLLIALLAKLSGQHQVRAIADWAALRAHELAHLFRFSRATMPHATTRSRVLGYAVDVPALHALLHPVLILATARYPPALPLRWRWTAKPPPSGYASTIPLGHTQGVHLVAAYLPQQGVTLIQL